MGGYVYILASHYQGTLYIGVTADLLKRVWQHKEKITKGFTKKYSVDKLVYFEEFAHISAAIHREKRLKEWQRAWKIDLICQFNPEWRDLYYKLA